MSNARQLLMVVGPGRSGTSVLTNVFERLGYSIPQPEIAADATNPSGFGEPAWLVDFHRKLMRAGDVQNSDARPASFADVLDAIEKSTDARERATEWLATCFADADYVVLKDPRLLWFTMLWEQVATELGVDYAYVTPLRHPAEVVASKQQWYESPQTMTNQLAAWMNGVLYTERATRGSARGFVEFDTMLTDWVGAVTALDEQAGLPPVREALTRHYRNADAAVDPSLRRSTATWDELDLAVPMRDLAERIWHEVRLLASTDGPPPERDAQLDDLRVEYGDMYAWAEAMSQSTAAAERRVGVREGRRVERRKRRERVPSATTEAPEEPIEATEPTGTFESSVSASPAGAHTGGPVPPATDAAGRAQRLAMGAVAAVRRPIDRARGAVDR